MLDTKHDDSRPHLPGQARCICIACNGPWPSSSRFFASLKQQTQQKGQDER